MSGVTKIYKAGIYFLQQPKRIIKAVTQMFIKHKDGMTYELFLVAGLETGVTVYAGV